MRLVVESGGFWGQEPSGLWPIAFAGTDVRDEVMVENQVVDWGRVDG